MKIQTFTFWPWRIKSYVGSGSEPFIRIRILQKCSGPFRSGSGPTTLVLFVFRDSNLTLSFLWKKRCNNISEMFLNSFSQNCFDRLIPNLGRWAYLQNASCVLKLKCLCEYFPHSQVLFLTANQSVFRRHLIIICLLSYQQEVSALAWHAFQPTCPEKMHTGII